MIIENREEIKLVLENGGVIAYVTDTVWGWAVFLLVKKL